MAETVADVVIGVSADVTPLMRETARAGRAVNKFGADMTRDMGNAGRGTVAALGQASAAAATFGKQFAGGLALGLVSAGFAAMTTNIRATIGGIADMADEADRVGVSAKQFQALQFGMKLAGVEADEFSSSLSKFSDNLGDAGRGSGKLGEILKSNGIALRDAGGGMRETTAILSDFADMIQRVPDEATRMSLITEAFGKSGKAMTLALSDGSAGLAEMQRAAEAAGIILDDSIIARARELDDQFDVLTAQASTFFRMVAVGAAGAAADLASVVTSMVVPDDFAALLGGLDPNAVLGADMASGLEANGQLFRDLKGEIIEYGAQLSVIRDYTNAYTESLGVLSDQLVDAGFDGASYQIDLLAAKANDARVAFENGEISLQEYVDILNGLGDAAQDVGIILGDVEGVDFSGAAASADAFKGSMERLGSAAFRAYNKIKMAMGLGQQVSAMGAVVLSGDKTGVEFPAETPMNFPSHTDTNGIIQTNPLGNIPSGLGTAPIVAPHSSGGGGGGASLSSAALDALISDLETEREVLEEWYEESAALLAGATDAQLEQLGGRHEAIERLEKKHQERLSSIRGGGDDDALGNAASFFNSLATITQAGGEKANKAYRVFAAAEALINTYRAASQTLADPRLGFVAKFAAVASVFTSGMGLVSALKGGGSKGGSGSGSAASSGGGGATSSAAQSVANITLYGDTFSKASVEDLFKQINEGVKQGRIINLVNA